MRSEQARQTRLRILDAAQRRFAERGFAGTTVEAIATEAGVAVDTVFAAFRSKRGVLQALMDLRTGGDDLPIDLLERSGPQAVRREPDQRRQLELFADGIAGILERAAPVDEIMRSAAPVDAEIAALRTRFQEQRHRNIATAAGWVAANGPLRGGIAVADAATVMWTLTSPEVHHLLRVTRGWDPERFVAWLADTLVRTLLP